MNHRIRRTIYFAAAAIIGALTIFGVIPEAHADNVEQIVMTILAGLVGTGALSLAGAKTHEGSDDPTTVKDVLEAQVQATPVLDAPVAEPDMPPMGEDFDIEDLARADYDLATRREE